MSFIRELERLQKNIAELNQTFDALKKSVGQYQHTRSEPEYPNELRKPDTTDLVDPPPRKKLEEATPEEWDSVSRRFYRELN